MANDQAFVLVLDDLAPLETTEAEAMYEQVIGRLSDRETLVGLHVRKTSFQTITTVNKLTTAPEVKHDALDELVQLPSAKAALMQPSRSETNLFSGYCSPPPRGQHFDGFLHQTHDR